MMERVGFAGLGTMGAAMAASFCACCQGANESPNHARLLTFTSTLASGSWRMISSPNASS